MKKRLPYLAVIQTHPIQYQAPLWRQLAQGNLLRVKVYYASRHGCGVAHDPLYKQSFAWDIPLTEGYPHEFLPSVRLPFPPGPVANRWPRGLGQALARESVDAVMLNGYMTGAAWAGYVAARRLRLPILLRGDSHLHRPAAPPLRGWVKTLALRNFLGHVRWCLAIGEWNREYWRHYGMPDERIRTTLYAVDNARFRRARESQPDRIQNLRSGWGAGPDDTVFAYVGNFQPHKGVDVLLRAFLRLCEKRRDVHLVLIGTGPEEDALRRLGSKEPGRIHFAGFVNQGDLPFWLSAIDMLVLPSRFESWGLAVNEAMAAGAPVIVTDACGSGPDLVARPGTGLIVKHDDVDDLVQAMHRACDPQQRAQWRQNIPAVLERASFEDNARVIAECLYEILGDDARDG